MYIIIIYILYYVYYIIYIIYYIYIILYIRTHIHNMSSTHRGFNHFDPTWPWAVRTWFHWASLPDLSSRAPGHPNLARGMERGAEVCSSAIITNISLLIWFRSLFIFDNLCISLNHVESCWIITNSLGPGVGVEAFQIQLKLGRGPRIDSALSSMLLTCQSPWQLRGGMALACSEWQAAGRSMTSFNMPISVGTNINGRTIPPRDCHQRKDKDNRSQSCYPIGFFSRGILP